MKIPIIETLTDIAKNEHEKFKTFRKKFINYCKQNEHAVEDLLRFLRGKEHEISDCLNGRIKIEVERAIVIKVLKTIRTEIDIVRYWMRHPGVLLRKRQKPPEPAGTWTNDKIDLIELIYAIQKSVNNGNVSIKALQECFEYIFQIELGNIYKRKEELCERNTISKTWYIESLIENLNQIINDLNK